MKLDLSKSVPLDSEDQVRFKTLGVKREFAGVSPGLQRVVKSAPKSLTITSGRRSPVVNRMVGGVPNSLHQTGDAIDIRKDDYYPEAINYFKGNGLDVLDEGDHLHVQGKVANDNLDGKKVKLDMSKSIPLDSPEDDGISALSLADRAKLGFSNQRGAVDYLKGKGIDAEYKGGELYAGGKPADPSALKSLSKLANPFSQIASAVRGFGSSEMTPDELERQKARRSIAKDLPSDLAESPADIMNLITTLAGGSAGAAAGAFGGPAAPLTVPAGMVSGGALGGFASEKAKEGIGKRLGVYKNDGEYFTPEASREATIGGVTSLLPAGLAGAELGAEALSRQALKRNLPQRLFASGTGMNLDKQVVQNPESVELLLREGAGGINSKVAAKKALSKVEEGYSPLLSNKTILPSELEQRLSSIPSSVSKKYSSDQRQIAKESSDEVLDRFKKVFLPEPMPIETPGGVMKAPSYEAFKEDMLSKVYKQGTPAKVVDKQAAYVDRPSEASMNDIIDYYLNKEMPNDISITKPFLANPRKTITKSAGGYPVNIAPMYSEDVRSRLIKGHPLDIKVKPKTVNPSDFVKETKVIPRSEPLPDESDIARLYKQAYPKEDIPLPSRMVVPEKTPVGLEPLHFEKSLQAKEASARYINPDANITSRKEAKAELADRLRNIIEEKAPGYRELNKRQNAYRQLRKGFKSLEEKSFRRNPSTENLKNSLFRALTGGSTSRRRLGQELFDLATYPYQGTEITSKVRTPRLFPNIRGYSKILADELSPYEE